MKKVSIFAGFDKIFTKTNNRNQMQKLIQILVVVLIATSMSAQEDLTNWFHQDPSSGKVGVSTDRTYKELLDGRASSPVVVAIIDSGMDVEHEDLQDNIWVNTDEIPNNGIDDDKNGYVDDVNGWNFIGGPNGENVNSETYEVTRLYGKYKYKFENAKPELLSKKDRAVYDEWLTWKEEVDSKRAGAEKSLAEIDETEQRISDAFDALAAALEADSLSFDAASIESLQSDDQMVLVGQRVALNIMGQESVPGIGELKKILNREIAADKVRQQEKLDYAYNPDFDSRKTIVKDNYADGNERIYGNNDVEGPDALHGTHVGGIVGAVRNNGIGMNGVADNVQLMSIRAVPNGDERDKDVANAIRYAVDNGASIINMSFGKGYSWDKKLVEEAIKYAEKKDVLLVHAAGNSAQDNDVANNFPNDKVKKGWWIFKKEKPAKNWIEVGALSYKTGQESVATFSNYGQQNVDIFAPGVQIYATLPDNKYRFLQGTSMASPVVAGVATVLRSYFPTLTAQQVKYILENSTTDLDFDVKVPGKDEVVPFSKLSQTGGVVNLYNAVKMAMTVSGKKKIKSKSGNA